MRSIFVLILMGIALLTLAFVVRSGAFSRKDPGRPINAAMRAAMEAEGVPELSSADAETIREKYPTARKLPSGLSYVLRAQGSGGTPRLGSEVIAHYDGRLLDGTPFDSSYKRGSPIAFRLGAGNVIRGWEEAFANMQKGEKRTLIIPYWLAYGTQGRPPKIPPKATLVFEVELVDFN